MVWVVSAVNATTANTQNEFNEDMCIKNASIIFDDAHIESIVFNAYRVYDSNNNLIESKDAITAIPSEYTDILTETLKSYCNIISMQELTATDTSRYRACFNIDGGAGSYYLTIEFAKSIVQWNEFSGKAWYELEKWKEWGHNSVGSLHHKHTPCYTRYVYRW